jgi:predicted TIM-barrel fold metal-dependent hydrolase
LVVIDSQVHVWQAETPDRPWFSPEAHLPNPFGYENLLREMKAAGVDRAVLVPPGWEGGRPDFALEGVARHPGRFIVMGRIALDKPDSIALLPQWTAPRGMVGIRLAFQKKQTQAWLNDGTADWFWPAAEKYDIPLMVFAPGQHDRLCEIARAHPGLRIIIDHMGLMREKDAPAAAAIERLIPLADCPNLSVKVTSVPFYSTEPYPYRNLHDSLRRLIGAFGPGRSFWGTDITRIWSLCSYRECVTLFTEELDFLSAEDLEWVMGRGIAEFLRWPLTR